MVVRQYSTFSVDYLCHEHRLNMGFSRFIFFKILEAPRTDSPSSARRPTGEQRPARVWRGERRKNRKKGKRFFGMDNEKKNVQLKTDVPAGGPLQETVPL